MLSKSEVAQTLLGGSGSVVDFRFGAITGLQDAQVNELPDLVGDALVIGVSPRLLAASRRDGGLPNTIGVFDFGSTTLGALFICSADELHVVLIEPGAPEIQALLAHAQATQELRVLVAAGMSDYRLMLVKRSDALGLLCKAGQRGTFASTLEVTDAVGAALEFLALPENLSQLGLPGPLPAQVVTHFVLTPSREADIERTASQVNSLH